MTFASAFELEPGERVLIEARKHWLLFVLELLPYALFAVLPFVIPALLRLLPQFAPFADLFDYGKALPRAVLGAWFLFVWTSAWSAFTRYYLNLWILTDRRIVEITQRGYFNREVSSVFLSRVQDVTTEIVGALFSILDIGNISVQSAGTVDEFHMNGIKSPERMRDFILNRAGKQPQPSDI